MVSAFGVTKRWVTNTDALGGKLIGLTLHLNAQIYVSTDGILEA